MLHKKGLLKGMTIKSLTSHGSRLYNSSSFNLNSSMNTLQISFSNSKNCNIKGNSLNQQFPNTSFVTHYTCFVSNEWYKGVIFLSILTAKFTITLPLVYSSKICFIVTESCFFLFSVLSCIICIFSSPGIIPRTTNGYQKIKNKLIVLKGRLFRSKVCAICGITRPVGSTHCKRCNICVKKLDHHCKWIGNCIGIKNYRYFFSFISILSVYLLFSCVACSCMIFSHSGTINIVFSIVISIISLVLFIFVFGLLICHCYYIYKGQTTYMHLKYKNYFAITGCIFNQGFRKNFKNLFCRTYRDLIIKYNTQTTFYHNSTLNSQDEEKFKQLLKSPSHNIYVNCFINNSNGNVSNSNAFLNSTGMINTNGLKVSLRRPQSIKENSCLQVKTSNCLNFTFKKQYEEDKISSIENNSHFSYSNSKKSNKSNMSNEANLNCVNE